LELTGVGRPLRGTEIRIVVDGVVAEIDAAIGEIEVRSETLMDRYDGEPDVTACARR
jgi:long-subunit acyl-CoA synthetase (AMP-forming)